MNVLVFGKDGQLGKAFRVLLDTWTHGLTEKPLIHWVGRAQCDLTDELAINRALKQCQPNLIINASAYTAVDKAETERALAFAVNARAPELMAQYAAHQGATLLHYSTDYVFDGEKYGFYLEDDLRNPLGVYGKSKAAGEEAIVSAFLSNQNDPLCTKGQYGIFRTSWVYGDGGNFIRTILRLAKERAQLKVISDQYGVPTSADCLAQCSFDLAVDAQGHLRKFSSGFYHAVANGETTWYGVAVTAVQAAFDAGVVLKLSPDAIAPIPATDYPLPAPRPMNSRMSTDKLRQALLEQGDMSKLKQLSQPWEEAVRAYVRNLANHGLI